MSKSKQLILKKTHEQLNQFLEQKADALPKDLNETRWLQNVMSVLQETKNIEKMKPASVRRAVMKGAYLNLDFFMKECYAIPYGNKLQFQTDWKGEEKLAYRYSVRPIKNIRTKVVREGDEYQYWEDEEGQHIKFKPKPFNNADIIGAYALVEYENGSKMHEDMSTEDIEKVRQKYSKMPNSMMWKNSFGEACKKTVLRRLLKHVQIEFENTEQVKAFEEGGDAEFDNKEKKKEKSPFDEPVDVEYEEVDDEEEDEENLSDEELADKVAEDMEEDDD
jgi:recombination protein RecT